jgi:hypothetical protein
MNFIDNSKYIQPHDHPLVERPLIVEAGGGGCVFTTVLFGFIFSVSDESEHSSLFGAFGLLSISTNTHILHDAWKKIYIITCVIKSHTRFIDGVSHMIQKMLG